MKCMEEEGYPQVEKDAVPIAVVNNFEELINAIPKQIESEKFGRGVFEIKDDEGLITGHYKMEDGMCLCHTWSRSYQGFYDAIAPALKMHDLI